MRVIYGQLGQARGSIDGDTLFDADGTAIAYIQDDSLFDYGSGEWLGSWMSGLVFNVHGAPQGFAKGCKPTVAPMPPRLGVAPPRLRPIGASVRDEASAEIPEFLRSGKPHPWIELRDGWFR